MAVKSSVTLDPDTVRIKKYLLIGIAFKPIDAEMNVERI
jgi:hypothetical protein